VIPPFFGRRVVRFKCGVRWRRCGWFKMRDLFLDFILFCSVTVGWNGCFTFFVCVYLGFLVTCLKAVSWM
jgi:hypothetical protein